MFKLLSFISPFPPWEVLGIVIDPTAEFREGLSIPVSLPVNKLTFELIEMVKNR